MHINNNISKSSLHQEAITFTVEQSPVLQVCSVCGRVMLDRNLFNTVVQTVTKLSWSLSGNGMASHQITGIKKTKDRKIAVRMIYCGPKELYFQKFWVI